MHRRLYASVSRKPSAPLPEHLALLPPMHLYRRIMKVHKRQLTAAERAVGDGYVKSEFERMKNVENPVHVIGFLTQWQVILHASFK